MSKKIIRLTESELKRYIRKVISEQVKQPTGDFTTIGRFGTSDAKHFEKRGFTVKGGVAILKHPNPKLVITVKPSQKGWAAYQGGVLKFDLPHDDCDVELDKLIRINSQQGGNKIGINEQVSNGERGQECYRYGEIFVCVNDKSGDVENLQKDLNKSDCQKGLPPIQVDGVFGPKTKERIMINQKSKCKLPFDFNTQQYRRVKTETGERYVPVKVSGTNLG